MGTRGLTAVYKDGTHKIAQYGQWDHYPSGQGITALNFLGSGKLPALIANLDKIEWLTNEHYEAATKHITEGRQFITMEESAQIDRIFPFLSRNHGAGILELVADYEGDGPIYLRDEIAFAADSLLNEGTYVIDLDAGTFEVYGGYQTEQHEAGRFASVTPREGYYPVRLVKTYPLADLPTEAEFLEDLEGDDEE